MVWPRCAEAGVFVVDHRVIVSKDNAGLVGDTRGYGGVGHGAT